MTRKDIRGLLVTLRVAVDDADAVMQDMLRPPGERELGRVLHRQNYEAARKTIVHTLELLVRFFTDDSDPPAGGAAAVSGARLAA